jgi:hypothetical protein
MRQYLLVFASLVLCPSLQAQTLAAIVDREASSAAMDVDSTLRTSGALIGDYDAISNPGGTQTRLGLFGGSGNMPIPAALDVLSASGGSASPEGVLDIGLDLPALSGSLSGLALDLAPGAAFPTTASARLTYQGNFHTVNPNCIFPNLGAVTIPLGEIGQIRDIVLMQTEAAALQLAATPDPQRFDLEAVVPAMMSLVVEITFGGDPQLVPLTDLPVLLPLSGYVQRTGSDRFELRAILAPQMLDGSLDLAGTALPPTPLSLPCLSQPANPDANLILELVANALDYELEFSFDLVAEAIEQMLPGPLIFADGFE